MSISTRITLALAALACALLSFTAAAPAASSAGELDPSFGEGGLVTDHWDASDRTALSAGLVDSEGRSLAAGIVFDNGLPSFAAATVVRYLPDGSRDTSFGEGGVAQLPAGDFDHLSVGDIALDSQSRILISGQASTADPGAAYVARLLPDGTPDASFGEGGIAFLPGPSTLGRNVGEGRSGRILVAGVRATGGVAMRLEANGQVDESYGEAGTATYKRFLDPEAVGAAAILPSGKVFFAGSSRGGSHLVMLRLNREGLRSGDESFYRKARIAPSSITAADRGLLVGGTIEKAGKGRGRKVVVVRIADNLHVDRRFGRHGRAIVSPGFVEQRDFRVYTATDRRGRILFGTTIFAGHRVDPDPAVGRLTHGGRLDRGFGKEGTATVGIGGDALVGDLAVDGGSPVLFGSTDADGGTAVLARFLP